MGKLESLWLTIMHKPLFGLLLSLVVYQFALWLYNRTNRNILVHPVTVSTIIVALFLKQFGLPFDKYISANQILYFLLGPATVALAVPLHQQFHHLRKLALPAIVTVIFGGTFAAICAVGIAWLLGASEPVLLSLSPKSVTTPIALGIAEKIGALTSLTTGVVVFTGIAGAMLSPVVFYLLRLKDPQLQGLVLGINAHALGTARSFEVNPQMGAFASLAMCLTGIFTALVLPYAIQLFH